MPIFAQRWFDAMRACGDDVRELLHDGHPTACVDGAAFGYVNAFTAHVNVGFFRGAELPDPNRLLEGTGKFMRHVKIRPGRAINEAAENPKPETSNSRRERPDIEIPLFLGPLKSVVASKAKI